MNKDTVINKLKDHYSLIYLIIALLLFNFFLGNFINKELWIDELFCIFVVSHKHLSIIQFLVEHDTNPPLFFLVLHVWHKLFQLDPFNLRILPILISNISFIFLYRLFIKRGLLTIAYALPIYLFTSHIYIFHTIDLRPYSFFILGICMSMYALYSPGDDKQLLNKILYVLGISIALYSHNFAMIFWFSQFVIYLIFYKWVRTFSFKELFKLNLFVFIIYLPWLVNIPSQLKNSRAISWIEPLGKGTLINLDFWFHTFDYTPLVVLFCLQLVWMLYKRDSMRLIVALKVFLHISAAALFIIICDYLGKHLFQVRYLQQTFISMYVFIALLFYFPKYQKILGVFLMAFLVFKIQTFSIIKFKNDTQGWTSDWKLLAKELKHKNQENLSIVFEPYYFNTPILVHDPSLKLIPLEEIKKHQFEVSNPFYFYINHQTKEEIESFFKKDFPFKNCKAVELRNDIRSLSLAKILCD